MSTASPAAAFGAPLINLMPRAEIERRARTSLLRRWVWGIVAALAIVAVASGAALTLRVGAEMRLLAENARTADLLEDMASLANVRAAVALEQELTRFRAQAMGSDVNWSALIGQMRDAAPAGVTVSGFEIAPGPIPVGEDRVLEIGAIGTVTYTSPSSVEIVPLIRAVRGLPGVMGADGWEVTSEGEADARTYSYVLQIVVDQTIYSGEYAGEDAG